METTRMNHMVILPWVEYVSHPLRVKWGDIPHENHMVILPWVEYVSHPLRVEWGDIPHEHPIYGHNSTLPIFCKQEYNIHLLKVRVITSFNTVELIFKSAQDYILWKLHQ